jgi:NADH-quinone oxidoreductase subunit B
MSTRSDEQLLDLIRKGRAAFRTTRLEAVANWSRKHSLFAKALTTSCCDVEMDLACGPRVTSSATWSSSSNPPLRLDLASLGCILPTHSPHQADLLIVGGTVTHRMVSVLKEVYEQMAEPKWVMALGACACSGGPYSNYATLPGIDRILPVDVYVPGCPPSPEAILDGIVKLQGRIQVERVPPAGRAARRSAGGRGGQPGDMVE